MNIEHAAYAALLGLSLSGVWLASLPHSLELENRPYWIDGIAVFSIFLLFIFIPVGMKRLGVPIEYRITFGISAIAFLLVFNKRFMRGLDLVEKRGRIVFGLDQEKS